MEPLVTAIVTALTSSLSDVAGESVKDAYNTLKRVLGSVAIEAESVNPLEKEFDNERLSAAVRRALLLKGQEELTEIWRVVEALADAAHKDGIVDASSLIVKNLRASSIDVVMRQIKDHIEVSGLDAVEEIKLRFE